MIVGLAAFLAVACKSNSGQGQGLQGPDKVNLEGPQPAAAQIPGWMNVRTLQIHPATTVPEEDDLTLDGILVGWIFEPGGTLKGSLKQPEKEIDLEDCWLSLRDRKLISKSSGELPSGPYLPGRYDRESELFYPSQTQVLRPVLPEPLMLPAIDVSGTVPTADDERS